jgi:hypothetical protein
MQLEPRTVLTAFTMTSPIAPGFFLPQIPPIGGIVLDLVGLNGGRIETALTPSQLFQGYFNTGTPANYRGNPGILGIQTGLTPLALNSLGSGLAAIAVRVTMDNGATGPGESDRHDDFLMLNGQTIGDFSDVFTEQTSSDGQTSVSFNQAGGFRNNSLDTGYFTSTDPVFLTGLFASILRTGEVVYQFQDNTPFEQPVDFTAGLTPGLANWPPVPVFALNPPFITNVQTNSPVFEGAPAAITVTARVGHENPRHPPVLTYQFDVNDDGTYPVSNETGDLTLTFPRPGVYVVPIRVYTEQGTVARTTATVDVLNVAPNLVSPGNETAVEGSLSPFGLGAFNDPGLDSPWTVHVNWGDGSPADTFQRSAIGALGSLLHAYGLDGNYTISVDVTDSLGATGHEEIPVNVTNVPPTIQSLRLTSPLRTGQTGTLSFTFTDPGFLDTFSVDVNWGDASATSAMLAIGTRSFASTHVFDLAPGLYSAIVTITDHGGGQAVGSAPFVVSAALTLGFTPGFPTPDNPPIEALTFLNTLASRQAIAPLISAPLSPLTLPEQPLGQALEGTKSSFDWGGGGSPPAPGGRSLEELLAFLKASAKPKTTSGLTTASSNPQTALTPVTQSTPMQLQRTENLAAGPPPAPAASQPSNPTADEGDLPSGRASRVMMLVVWTLSLRNQRRRNRLGRTSYHRIQQSHRRVV